MVKISICCGLLTTEVHNLVECHKHTHHCHDMEKIQSFKGLIPGSCTKYIAKLPLRRQVPSFPPICIERIFFFFWQHKHCVLLVVQLKKSFPTKRLLFCNKIHNYNDIAITNYRVGHDLRFTLCTEVKCYCYNTFHCL